MKRATNTKI